MQHRQKECSSATGLSGQWSSGHLWKKEHSKDRVSRVELGRQEQAESSKGRNEQEKKNKKASCGKLRHENLYRSTIRSVWHKRLRKEAEGLYWLVRTKVGRSVCHPEPVSLSICCVFWMAENRLKFSSVSQEKIQGFYLGALEGEGVLFNLTFLVFKLEDFQHPGVTLKSLSLGSLGAYQKSMAWRMEKVSKMWDWQEILAHFCLIFAFLACRGSSSANGKSLGAKPPSDKSAHKIHFELACSFWD